MDNLHASVAKDNAFWSEVDNFLFLLSHQEQPSVELHDIEFVRLGLWPFVGYVVVGLLNSRQNISILHQLDMLSFMHWVENSAILLLIAVKLIDMI